jgi:hypothetical protein
MLSQASTRPPWYRVTTCHTPLDAPPSAVTPPLTTRHLARPYGPPRHLSRPHWPLSVL